MLRKFLIFLFIALLLTAGVIWGLSKFTYSEGDRAGTVSKFSKRGYVFKTWEGELNVGGFSGQTGNFTPQLWHFTVPTDEANVIAKLEEAVTSGRRIKLHYEEHLYLFFWMGDSKYYVTAVEFADK